MITAHAMDFFSFRSKKTPKQSTHKFPLNHYLGFHQTNDEK